MKRRLWGLIGVLAILLGITSVTLAAPGDLLLTVSEPEPMVSCCGIGIDYDGTNILYTHYLDPKVHLTDLTGADAGEVALVNPDGTPFLGDAPNAIAYNFSDGMLYAGGWGSTNLYKIDLSTGVTTLVKANALAGFESFNFIDGLAWDPTDNTFWMSDDVSCNVRHLDVNGNDIGGFDGCALGLPSNSGLAVSLNGILWYGTNGVGDIYSLDTSTDPPTVLGTFAHPGGRDEDMVCGPKYTKADGSVVETLLSQDAYGNWFVVFEVAQGECTSPAEQVVGRMTGGGSVFTTDGMRVTHGFELNCDASKVPNNLQVNWGKGNRFHLESLAAAHCSDDPNIDEAPPMAGFDTSEGRGIGRYNGVSGATAHWIFTDAGEPGKNDAAHIRVWDAGGNLVLDVKGTLVVGNQQAHAE